MKKISRRTFLNLIGATTAAGCLTACGSSDSTSTTSTSSSSSSSSSTSSSDENITLRFVTWLSADKEQNERVAAAYTAEHPNITIEYEYYGDAVVNDYYTKVDLMILGNEEMDILVSGNYTDHAKRAVTGAYYPIDDLLAANGIDPTVEFDFAPTVNGETFALPFEWKSWLVMINKDLLDAAGLPIPPLDWTWDDYREYANAMTSGEGLDKVYGSLFVAWEQYCMLGMWSQMENYPFLKEDGSPNYDDPRFEEWIDYRMMLENDDQCQVSYATVKSTDLNYRSEFFNSKIGMMPISTFILTELDDVSTYPHDFQTTFAPIPTWGDNPAGSSLTEAVYYSVGANSPHPQEAFDYIYYYVTDGAYVKESSISAQADANKMDFINTMIEDPALIDVDTLESVIMNPNYNDRVYTDIPSYNSELISMMKEELELYFYGQETDFSKVVDTLMTRGEQIIAENEG